MTTCYPVRFSLRTEAEVDAFAMQLDGDESIHLGEYETAQRSAKETKRVQEKHHKLKCEVALRREILAQAQKKATWRAETKAAKQAAHRATKAGDREAEAVMEAQDKKDKDYQLAKPTAVAAVAVRVPAVVAATAAAAAAARNQPKRWQQPTRARTGWQLPRPALGRPENCFLGGGGGGTGALGRWWGGFGKMGFCRGTLCYVALVQILAATKSVVGWHDTPNDG